MIDSEVIHVLDAFLQDMNELEHRGQGKKPSTKAVGSTEARKKRIPSWLRRKHELIALRQQSQEMETRVEFLKLRQVKRRSIVQQQRNGLRRIKVLVDRELQRRRQAEHENAALKCHVRTCMRLCSAFRAAITTTLVSQASLNTVVPGSLHQLRISSTHTFNMLEKRVDRRFQAVQVILDEIQHTSVTLDEEQIQINSGNDEAATVMEYKCARVLPFDERSTSNAAWNIVEIGGVTQKQGSQVVRRSNDVYAVDSRFAVPLDHEELVMVDVHCVVKRFVVPEGVLLLAEANSDWFAHRGASALWDQQSHESIWCVVRGVPQEPACQLKAVARSEAVRQASHFTQDTEPLLRDHALFSFRELIVSQGQFLENSLWDSARNAQLQQTLSL